MISNPVYNFIIRHAEEGIGVTFEAAVEYQCIYITMFSRKNMIKLRRIVTDDQFDLFLGATLEMMYEQLIEKSTKEDNTNASNRTRMDDPYPDQQRRDQRAPAP